MYPSLPISKYTPYQGGQGQGQDPNQHNTNPPQDQNSAANQSHFSPYQPNLPARPYTTRQYSASNNSSGPPSSSYPSYNPAGSNTTPSNSSRPSMILNYTRLKDCQVRNSNFGQVNTGSLSPTVLQPVNIPQELLTPSPSSQVEPLTPTQQRSIGEISTLSELSMIRSHKPQNPHMPSAQGQVPNPPTSEQLKSLHDFSYALTNLVSTNGEDRLSELIRIEREQIMAKKIRLQEAAANADKAQALLIAEQQELEKQEERRRQDEEKLREQAELERKEREREALEQKKRENDERKEREAQELARYEESRRYCDSVFQRLITERNVRSRSNHIQLIQKYSEDTLRRLVSHEKEAVETFIAMSELPLDDDMLTIIKIIAFARHHNFNLNTMGDAYFTRDSLDECLSLAGIQYPLPELIEGSGDVIISFHYENGVICKRLFDDDQTIFDVLTAAFLHSKEPKDFHLVTDDGTSITFADDKALIKDTSLASKNAKKNVIEVRVLRGRN